MKSKPLLLKSFLLTERVQIDLKTILEACFMQFWYHYLDLKKT